MRHWCWMVVLLVVGVLAAPALRAQADTLLVTDIRIEGDKRTRKSVIYRESAIKVNDRIARADLPRELERTYSTLMNTGLFASLEMSYDTAALGYGLLDLQVSVRETWYLYPVPVFSLADRNFNVWWTEQNRSLDRIDLGLQLTYYNFTGRRDRFRMGFTTGYTRSYEAAYRLPYVNKAGSIGVDLSATYDQRREQNYRTVDNEQVFYRDDERFNYQRLRLLVGTTYRRALYTSHRADLEYREAEIADTIANALNPEFFGDGRNSQRYFRFRYEFRDDRRDVRNYPWEGTFLRAQFIKDGLGITGERSGMTVSGSFSRFVPLGERYSVNMGVSGKYSLIRTRQPFLENRAIGFGDNGLVGYQFYVVDGLDMAIWRIGLRRELLRTKLDMGKLVFIDAFRFIPLRILVAAQLAQGISNSPFAERSNDLTNNLLSGASLGLDIVLYFDMVASVQYNRNHLGEDGVFLNLNLNF